jgi:hypothetical protein
MPPPSHCAANSQPVAAQAAKRCTSFFCIDLPGRSGRKDRPHPAGFAGSRTSCVALSPLPSQAEPFPLERTFARTIRLPRRQEKTDIGPDKLRPAPAPPLHKADRPFKPDLLNRMHCGDGSGKPMLPRTHGHASQIRDAGPATPGNYVARYRGSRDCMAFPPPSATCPPPGVANGTNRGGLSAARNRPRTPRRTHAQPASPGARPPAPRPRCRSR